MHDYRYDAFTDTLNDTEITEYLAVPSTSPFIVTLNEIPLKSSPSTMEVKAITGFSGGQPVFGETYTEVSALPSSGQYFPDYYTGADDDDNWNTGKILFNSANAGQMVQVKYQGTGSLASLSGNHYPKWMTDRGNGTDGVFAPTANTTISGDKNYKAVYIPSGVTVTVSRGTTIRVQGACVVNGAFSADGLGATGGTGAGAGNAGNGGGNGGAGNGGAGGSSPQIYTSELELPNGYGAGGGGGRYASNFWNVQTSAGGTGGGSVFLIAKEIGGSGSIHANGTAGVTNGNARGGGGGGGVIFVAANVIANTITIQANGGSGNSAGATGTIIRKEFGND